MLDRLMYWIFLSLAPPKPPAPPVQEDPALLRFQKAQEDDSLLARFNRANHGCPDCAGALLMGPEGGCAVNVKCEGCGHEFNIGLAFGEAFFVERIRWTTP